MKNTKQLKYTDEMKAFLKENVKGRHYDELAVLFNERFGTSVKSDTLKSYCNRYRWSTGFTGHFEKGQVSHNKGKRQEDIIKDPEALARVRASWFKKGHTPHNAFADWEETTDRDGYIKIKVPGRRKLVRKHRYLYEQYHNVKVKKGEKVIFADGNKRNFDKDNLVLITNAECGPLNKRGVLGIDKDFTKLNISLLRLENAIKDKEDDEDGE